MVISCDIWFLVFLCDCQLTQAALVLLEVHVKCHPTPPCSTYGLSPTNCTCNIKGRAKRGAPTRMSAHMALEKLVKLVFVITNENSSVCVPYRSLDTVAAWVVMGWVKVLDASTTSSYVRGNSFCIYCSFTNRVCHGQLTYISAYLFTHQLKLFNLGHYINCT